jgi:hypothetical protein
MTKQLGLYVSYNQKENGPSDAAVRISNKLGYVHLVR